MYQGKCVLLSECIKLKFIPCQKIGKPFLQTIIFNISSKLRILKILSYTFEF